VRAALLLVATLACARAAGPALPAGWWTTAAGDLAMRFDPGGCDLVTAEGADRREVRWVRQAGGFASRDGTFHAGRDGERLVVRDLGRDLVLTRADAVRAEALDRAAAAVIDPKVACARAEACCREAMRILGAVCEPPRDLGDLASARRCASSVRGLRMVLESKGRPIPAACR
jgi:hypothetical protein